MRKTILVLMLLVMVGSVSAALETTLSPSRIEVPQYGFAVVNACFTVHGYPLVGFPMALDYSGPGSVTLLTTSTQPDGCAWVLVGPGSIGDFTIKDGFSGIAARVTGTIYAG